eukprot:g1913.t1
MRIFHDYATTMCPQIVYKFFILLVFVYSNLQSVYATHTRKHALAYGESTCDVDGSPCQYNSDCSSGLCTGLYAIREEDLYDRSYLPLEKLDESRLSRRIYPFGNSTAWSLQQYKDAINNGNDYNLFGENVGEGTAGTYIPEFIKPTTGALSQGRQGLVSINVDNVILWAGGSMGPYPGNESDVVDIYNTDTKTFSTAKLSKGRSGLAVASSCIQDVGDTIGGCSIKKAIFAGGYYTVRQNPNPEHSSINPNDIDPFYTNIVDVYDVDTNSWTVTNMVEKRGYASAVIFLNKLYIAGGTRGRFEQVEYSNSVEVYDLATNTWEPWVLDNNPPRYGISRPPHELSNYRANMCVTAARGTVGWGKIFFAGGSTGGFYQFTNPTLVDDTVDIYDVLTNTWSVKKLSVPRSHCAAEYMSSGLVYFAGGMAISENSNMVDILDLQTGSFDHTILSQPRQGIASSVLKNPVTGLETLVFIGGLTFGGSNRWIYEGQAKHSQRIDFFDGTEWKVDTVPQGHSEHAAAAYKDIIYVAGGVDNIYRYVSRVERIERAHDCLDYKCFKRKQYGESEFFRPPCPQGTTRNDRSGECCATATGKCGCKPVYANNQCTCEDGQGWYEMLSTNMVDC